VKFPQFDEFIVECFCSAGHPSGHSGGPRLGRCSGVEHGSVSPWESEVLHFRESLTKWLKNKCHHIAVHIEQTFTLLLSVLIIYFWHAGPWRPSTHPFFLWIQIQIQWRSSRPYQSLITSYIFRSLWVSPLNYVMFIVSDFI